jgi:glycosyltransferase involved in cell wall biosynthesis
VHLGSSRSSSIRPDPGGGSGGTRSKDVPVVSVVIPTRDRLAMFRRALGSALAQVSVAVEVVVVDDGSTDGTAGFVRAVDDPRIAVVRHGSPRGVATARNAGADVSTGEWLAFLDDDDLWAPHKLARQLAVAEVDRACWVYAGAVEIDRAGELLGGQPPPSSEVLLESLPRHNVMPAGSSNVVVLRETFRACGGFDTGLRHLADWDLWLRLAERGSPACVPEPLVAYRIHPTQATMDTTGMMAEADILHDRHGVDPVSIRRWLAWSHLRRGNRGAAVAAYLRAVVDGDVSSVGRAAVAALHPRPTGARKGRVTEEDRAWTSAARAWIRAAGEG